MRWLDTARKYFGTTEVKGAKHNPTILRWWTAIRAPFTDDESPWCAAFVGGVLEECGIKSSRSAAARSYLKWGQRLSAPTEGCIVVFWRGSPTGWSGHVGFLIGRNGFGNLLVLGGNQNDKVTVSAFDPARVLSYRWPSGEPVPSSPSLPLIHNSGKVSTNEE